MLLSEKSVLPQSMVKRTLGGPGAAVASTAYVFLHYTLLVAYISRAGATVASSSGQPVWASAAAFTVLLGGVCYGGSPRLLDVLNTGLLALVVIAFLGLVGAALPGVHLENLEAASWPAVIDTLPVVALSFVYQNVVPVVVTNLEGDVGKVRLAVWTGLAIPLFMFVGWEAAMLGSIEPGVFSRGALPCWHAQLHAQWSHYTGRIRPCVSQGFHQTCAARLRGDVVACSHVGGTRVACAATPDTA